MTEKPHNHTIGTLSDTEIVAARSIGLVVIDPFQRANVGTNSYDVTLGEWYYREQHPLCTAPVYNIYDEASINRVWGAAPEQARTLAELALKFRVLPMTLKTLSPEDRVILLAPGETILAHTVEFIGGTAVNGHAVTTKMHARSSIGRSMLGVCKCAGLGDVGFINRWTMEITSFSQHWWIPLVVGRRIAQIEFQYLPSVKGSYAGGKYQGSSDLDELKRAWKPSMMLPRLYLDREVMNGDVREPGTSPDRDQSGGGTGETAG